MRSSGFFCCYSVSHCNESNKYLTPSQKTWLSTWWQNPCWQSQRSGRFFEVGHQVCTHLRRDFVPLLFADPLQSLRFRGFHALALTVHGPVHRPFDVVQFSCPLSRKTPPKHVSTSMFDGGDGVLGVISSIPPPPNTASWVDAKELDFGLIWPQHFHPVLLWIIGRLQTGLYMCFLEQGDLAGAAGFQSFTA